MKFNFNKYDIPIALFLIILVAVKYWPEKKEDATDGAENGIVLPTLDSVTISGYSNGHPYVDLGLPSGALWGVYNCGETVADSVRKQSDCYPQRSFYYLWATIDTVGTGMVRNPSGEYDVSKCIVSVVSNNYEHHYRPYVENKTSAISVLPEHDVARLLGNGWRMPSMFEFGDLQEACEWTWVTYKGCNGLSGKSKKNGNVIFLPAIGGKGFVTFGVRPAQQNPLIHFYNDGYSLFYLTSNCKMIDIVPYKHDKVTMPNPYYFQASYNGGVNTKYQEVAIYAEDRLIGAPVRAILEPK